MEPGTLFHVVTGGIGLLSGAAALASSKGQNLHRKAGLAFLVSMIAMAVSGFVLAAILPIYVTMMAASVTFYLVISGTITARQRAGKQNLTDSAILALGLGVCLRHTGDRLLGLKPDHRGFIRFAILK